MIQDRLRRLEGTWQGAALTILGVALMGAFTWGLVSVAVPWSGGIVESVQAAITLDVGWPAIPAPDDPRVHRSTSLVAAAWVGAPLVLGVFWFTAAYHLDRTSRRTFRAVDGGLVRQTAGYTVIAIGVIFPLIILGLIGSAWGVFALITWAAAGEAWARRARWWGCWRYSRARCGRPTRCWTAGTTADRHGAHMTTAQRSLEPSPGLKARLIGLAVSSRPRQWPKNLLVLAAVLFSGEYHSGSSLLAAVAATAIFTLATAGLYLLNDAIDAPRDREHPVKRRRPIAAGAVPVGLAVGWALRFRSRHWPWRRCWPGRSERRWRSISRCRSAIRWCSSTW